MPLGSVRFGLVSAVASGDLELIQHQSATAGDSVMDFSDIKESDYKAHLLTVTNFQPNTDSKGLGIRFFENGTLESDSVYQFGYKYMDTGTANSLTTTYSRIRAIYSTGNAAGESGSGHSWFYELGGSSTQSYQNMMHGQIHNTGGFRVVFGAGYLPQFSNVDGIRLYPISGTIDVLDASLYGLKQ